MKRSLSPMLAVLGEHVQGRGWVYEPKYDGIRVLALCTPTRVRLMTRNQKDKAAQFPEITEALRAMARRLRREFVLDGEIVALRRGVPIRFQALQDRMHVQDPTSIEQYRTSQPTCLMVFDLLIDGKNILLDAPWTERRARLERRFGALESTAIRLTVPVPESGRGTGERMLARARKDGWEGIIAKRMDAPYLLGIRSPAWLKLKVEFRQELVVGGFTEPRRSRQYLGALLLGYYDGDTLVYAGHTGGGFTHRGLKAMHDLLVPLEQRTSPFHPTPRTNERAHWVRPTVVVEVKFSEWTDDGRMRQPIFLGVRDDKDAREVTREAVSVQRHHRSGARRV